MMEQIIYELNSKKYLLVEIPMAQGRTEKMDSLVKKHGGIYQGIKEFKRESFWHGGYAIAKYLIPENTLEAFNAENIE